MKKILFTLLLGLVIVSCDKEDDGVMPVALSQDTEIVSSESQIDLVMDYLLNNLDNLKGAKKGVSSGKGSDYISVNLFTEGSFTYMVLLDETNDDLCFGSTTVTTLFYDNSAGDGSVLTVEDSSEAEILSINGNFAGFFAGGLNSITKLSFDAAGLLVIGNSANFDASNSATIATN